LPSRGDRPPRGELLPRHFTLTVARSWPAGGVFSVALSLISRPVGVTHHPALRSPDFPPASGRMLAGGRPGTGRAQDSTRPPPAKSRAEPGRVLWTRTHSLSTGWRMLWSAPRLWSPLTSPTTELIRNDSRVLHRPLARVAHSRHLAGGVVLGVCRRTASRVDPSSPSSLGPRHRGTAREGRARARARARQRRARSRHLAAGGLRSGRSGRESPPAARRGTDSDAGSVALENDDGGDAVRVTAPPGCLHAGETAVRFVRGVGLVDGVDRTGCGGAQHLDKGQRPLGAMSDLAARGQRKAHDDELGVSLESHIGDGGGTLSVVETGQRRQGRDDRARRIGGRETSAAVAEVDGQEARRFAARAAQRRSSMPVSDSLPTRVFSSAARSLVQTKTASSTATTTRSLTPNSATARLPSP